MSEKVNLPTGPRICVLPCLISPELAFARGRCAYCTSPHSLVSKAQGVNRLSIPAASSYAKSEVSSLWENLKSGFHLLPRLATTPIALLQRVPTPSGRKL